METHIHPPQRLNSLIGVLTPRRSAARNDTHFQCVSYVIYLGNSPSIFLLFFYIFSYFKETPKPKMTFILCKGLQLRCFSNFLTENSRSFQRNSQFNFVAFTSDVTSVTSEHLLFGIVYCVTSDA